MLTSFSKSSQMYTIFLKEPEYFVKELLKLKSNLRKESKTKIEVERGTGLTSHQTQFITSPLQAYEGEFYVGFFQFPKFLYISISSLHLSKSFSGRVLLHFEFILKHSSLNHL